MIIVLLVFFFEFMKILLYFRPSNWYNEQFVLCFYNIFVANSETKDTFWLKYETDYIDKSQNFKMWSNNYQLNMKFQRGTIFFMKIRNTFAIPWPRNKFQSQNKISNTDRGTIRTKFYDTFVYIFRVNAVESMKFLAILIHFMVPPNNGGRYLYKKNCFFLIKIALDNYALSYSDKKLFHTS